MLDTPNLLNILPRIQTKNMPKISKVKKKVKKTKTRSKVIAHSKEINKSVIKIAKTYIPKETEKYMCEKHKIFFRMKLQEWKK